MAQNTGDSRPMELKILVKKYHANSSAACPDVPVLLPQ